MKKQLFLLAGSLMIIGTAAAPVIASAQSNSQSSVPGHRRVVKHRVRTDAKLNQAVRDGVITDSQRTTFRAELKQLKSERQATLNKSSTKSERQTERAKLKSELKTWAETNNFPLSKIFPKLAAS